MAMEWAWGWNRLDRKQEHHRPDPWVIEEPLRNLPTGIQKAHTLQYHELRRLPCTVTICQPTTAIPWTTLTATILLPSHLCTFVNHRQAVRLLP